MVSRVQVVGATVRLVPCDTCVCSVLYMCWQHVICRSVVCFCMLVACHVCRGQVTIVSVLCHVCWWQELLWGWCHVACVLLAHYTHVSAMF